VFDGIQPLNIMIADRLHAAIDLLCDDPDEEAAAQQRDKIYLNFLLLLQPAGEC
jgi:hypothetical protein